MNRLSVRSCLRDNWRDGEAKQRKMRDRVKRGYPDALLPYFFYTFSIALHKIHIFPNKSYKTTLFQVLPCLVHI